MPEAVLGGYPKGEDFGTRLGYRMPEGREAFAHYFAQAIDLDGAEVEALAGLSTRTGATLVVGVIERTDRSLYCTAIFIGPNGRAGRQAPQADADRDRAAHLGQRRRIDAAGGRYPVGKLGAAICWENNMPLLRTAMYAKGVEIWCAPTVDERDMWRSHDAAYRA